MSQMITESFPKASVDNGRSIVHDMDGEGTPGPHSEAVISSPLHEM